MKTRMQINKKKMKKKRKRNRATAKGEATVNEAPKQSVNVADSRDENDC